MEVENIFEDSEKNLNFDFLRESAASIEVADIIVADDGDLGVFAVSRNGSSHGNGDESGENELSK